MQKLFSEFTFRDTKCLLVSTSDNAFRAAEKEIISQRKKIEDYIRRDQKFLTSLSPLPCLKLGAPKIAIEMHDAACKANVGPMAAVAGAIAEAAAKKMLKHSSIAIVNNGGDIFAFSNEVFTIGLFAGNGFGEKQPVLEISTAQTPLSVCSSSSFMGHSLSFGKCDLATAISRDGALSDAFATAICNSVKKQNDLKNVSSFVGNGLLSVLAVKGRKIAVAGKLPKLSFASSVSVAEKIVAFK
jgi:ApbE superfamily uncharacterized protein (UPF0280 family)